jgi:hypothetical protein
MIGRWWYRARVNEWVPLHDSIHRISYSRTLSRSRVNAARIFVSICAIICIERISSLPDSAMIIGMKLAQSICRVNVKTHPSRNIRMGRAVSERCELRSLEVQSARNETNQLFLSGMLQWSRVTRHTGSVASWVSACVTIHRYDTDHDECDEDHQLRRTELP